MPFNMQFNNSQITNTNPQNTQESKGNSIRNIDAIHYDRELYTVTVKEIPFLWGNSESQIIENSLLPQKDYGKPHRTLILI